MTYEQWIERNVQPRTVCGMCAQKTEAMVEAFPELRRVRGHVIGGNFKQYPHWWCEAPDGATVDPTAGQFDGVGIAAYVEHEGPEPTGKCPNCAGYCYNGELLCSDVCADAYARYVMHG